MGDKDTARAGNKQFAVTHDRIVHLVQQAAIAGECPPFWPAFDGNPHQISLKELAIDDVAGMRILDVGCNLGLRCLEAVAGGAAEVVGVDANPSRIAQAKAAGSALGLAARFYHLDVDIDPLPGGFDLVLCCGVLERSRNPTSVIESLCAASEAQVVIETESFAGAHAAPYLRELGLNSKQLSSLAELPLILVGRNGPAPPVPEARMYFTPSALTGALRDFDPRYSEVDTISTANGGRFAARCKRRRIGHLVVVAGASGVGKTTFLESLKREEVTRLLEPVGLADLGSWNIESASGFSSLPARIDRLALHYDMNRAARWPLKGFMNDEAIGLARVADRVTFLTLWADPAVLIARKRKRIGELTATGQHRSKIAAQLRLWWRNVKMRPFERERMKRRLRRQDWDVSFVSSHDNLVNLYDAWMARIAEFPDSQSWIINTMNQRYDIHHHNEWEMMRNIQPWRTD